VIIEIIEEIRKHDALTCKINIKKKNNYLPRNIQRLYRKIDYHENDQNI